LHDRGLCDFAVRLTLSPGRISIAEIDDLRRVNWSDEQIHHATQVIGYFNYINRVAEGLHVDPEDWMTPPPDEWRRRKGRFGEFQGDDFAF